MDWQIYKLPVATTHVMEPLKAPRNLSVRGIDPRDMVECCDVDFLDLVVAHLGRERVESAFNLHGDLSTDEGRT